MVNFVGVWIVDVLEICRGSGYPRVSVPTRAFRARGFARRSTGSRPYRTAFARASGTGRPRRRIIRARSSRQPSRMSSRTGSYRRTDLFERRRRLIDDWGPTSTVSGGTWSRYGGDRFIRDAWCSHWPSGVRPPFALPCKVSHLAAPTDLRLYRLHYRHRLVRNAKIDHLLVHRDSLSGSRYIPEFE